MCHTKNEIGDCVHAAPAQAFLEHAVLFLEVVDYIQLIDYGLPVRNLLESLREKRPIGCVTSAISTHVGTDAGAIMSSAGAFPIRGIETEADCEVFQNPEWDLIRVVAPPCGC